MITFRHRGDFSKATRFFNKMKEAAKLKAIEKHAKVGVEALSSATPVETGLTANSWHYRIEKLGTGYAIRYYNTNVNNGVNIAIILQYGHGTGTGGWVEGRDYINPAIQPVFDDIATTVWKEVIEI